MKSYSPWQHLGQMPDVELVWSRDDELLDGADARWFPTIKTIVMDARLRRLVSRCALAHELAHIVREDAPCDHEFFDNRNEVAADRLAARWLLCDLEELAVELATTSTHGHAAYNLRVTMDILEARLAGLHPAERHDLDRRVRELQGVH